MAHLNELADDLRAYLENFLQKKKTISYLRPTGFTTKIINGAFPLSTSYRQTHAQLNPLIRTYREFVLFRLVQPLDLCVAQIHYTKLNWTQAIPSDENKSLGVEMIFASLKLGANTIHAILSNKSK